MHMSNPTVVKKEIFNLGSSLILALEPDHENMQNDLKSDLKDHML